jgi:two-component sensor histidine kinase
MERTAASWISLRISDDGVGYGEGAARGLGMDIIEVLSQQLHAAMSYESTPGRGTLFALDLPRRVRGPDAA